MGTKQASAEDIDSQLDAVAHRLIDHAISAARWTQLIERIRAMHPKHAAQVCARLAQLQDEVDHDLALWEAIRSQLYFCVRGGVGSSPELCDLLRELYAKFEPDDPVLREAWLFRPYPPRSRCITLVCKSRGRGGCGASSTP